MVICGIKRRPLVKLSATTVLFYHVCITYSNCQSLMVRLKFTFVSSESIFIGESGLLIRAICLSLKKLGCFFRVA